MNYFVGDLARILNLSSEMIRYYEKMEMFKPDRQEGSNYRIYSAKDVLLLVTAMQLQAFQFKIKDIREMRNLPGDSYTREFLTDIIAFRENLLEEVKYKHWLLMRVNELIDRNHITVLNEGNFWLKRRPGQYCYPFLRIENSGEFECLLPETVTNTLFGEKILPFCDLIVKAEREYEQWDLVILKEYGDALELPVEGRKTVEPFLCACTIIKAEDFSFQSCEKLQSYVHKRNYHQIGDVRAFLCGGMALESSGYFMELQLPVEQV